MLAVVRRFLGLTVLAFFLPHAGATRLASRVFTTADGLGRDSVSCIVPDSKGFIWFCTSEGVSRYDGYEFVTYGVAQGLPHRSVNAVLETRAGIYLFATDLGISRLDFSKPPSSRTQFASIPRRDGMAVSGVFALFEDHAGEVWGATTGGLYRVDDLRGPRPVLQFISLGWGPDTAARSLAEDRYGTLWVGTSFGMCRRWPDGIVEWHNGPGSHMPHDEVHALLIDRHGTLWAGALSGLWKLQISSERGDPKLLHRYGAREGMASPRVHSLLDSHYDGHLWVGTALALSELVVEKVEKNERGSGHEYFRNYAADEGLSGRAVLSLGEDGQGALWAGVDHGLSRIARDGFSTYTEHEGMGLQSIVQVQESAGDLWAVSNQTTALVLRHLVNRRFIATLPVYPKSMRYFGWGTGQVALRDHEGGWWIATGEGLCRFPRVGSIEQLSTAPVKKVYTRKDRLPADDIFRLFEDSRGDIWITTLGGDASLSRWDRRTDTIHRYNSANVPGVPTAYAEDRAGNLWIGISNEVSTHRASGLLRYRDGQFDPFIDAGAIGWIPALYVDRSGKLLIGSTDGGLIQVAQPAGDHPRLASYPTASALSSISVRCMVEDLLGRLYVGTPRGVDRIEPESGRVRHYTIGNGLAGGTPNSMVRDRNGRIWVGTSLGLSRMVPSLDQPVPSPRIYITGLSVNGEPRSVAQAGVERIAGLRLEPSQTRLRIDFVGVGGPSGELLQYQYKLEGVDSAWSAPAIQRAMSYERLTPGHFRFVVRPVLAGAAVESATAEVSFELPPPVWRRSWFLTLAIAALCGFALFAHRYDLSRRLELERMRLRIARDLHDDLGASLTRMTILTELASRQTQPANPKAGGDLSRIAEMARGMVDALGELAWAVDPRRDDMASTSRRIRRYASDVLEPQGIAWALELSDAGLPSLSPEQRRHVLLIFQEALRNAARHSRCSRVELFLRVEADAYVVRIRDNGCGLPDPIPELGSGLLNLRSRAAALSGTLSIVSSPRAGTDLTVRFPAGKTRWRRMGRMFMLFRERPGVHSNQR